MVNRLSTYQGRAAAEAEWILVVEDDASLRELIVTVLGVAGYAVRAAASAEEALELTADARPAVVVTDIVLKAQSGYELCRILRERFGESLPIMFMSGVRTERFDVVAGFLIGCDDYIVKPFAAGEIVARVRRAVARTAAAPQLVASSGQTHNLTSRESEVLALLAEGLSQKEIAARLIISSKTVATHIQRILSKLDLHSRAEAVAWAYRVGLADPGMLTHDADRRLAVNGG